MSCTERREICLLNDSFPPIIDGVANVVVNYAANLPACGYDVSVVTPDCPGADDSAVPCPVIRYPSLDLRKQLGYTAGNPFSFPTLKELKDRRISLLHCHCPATSSVLARTLREEFNAPLVMTYHTKYDIDIAKAVKGKLIQDGVIKVLVDNVSACDELWVVSRGAGENIRALGYEGDYIVMENGVDIPRGRATQAEIDKAVAGYGLPGDVPVFLFVGRLMWYKGIKIILDALAALKSQDIDFRMVIIGKGADGEEIMQYSSRLGLDGKCFFTGPVYDRAELTAWYSRADMFLFPSTFDTNGLVVREAAATSLGTVMVGGSCAAEGVTNGHNGVFIEENAASLAVCLTKLIGNREAMGRIGENAASELYLSWGDAVKKAAERYEIVIDEYKSGALTRKRKTLTDEFFSIQGNFLTAYDRAQQMKKEFEDKIERYL